MGVIAWRYLDFLIILLIPTPLVLALFVAESISLCSCFLNVFSEYIFIFKKNN